MKPKIVIGADHGGYKLKEELKPFLKELGYSVEDVGTHSDDSCDYPDYAFKVAETVGKAASGLPAFPSVMGILICRSAGGMMFAADKVKGIRAVAAYDETSSKHSRDNNAANILGLSGDWSSFEEAKKIVKVWLETPFSQEERHARRLQKIIDFEKKVFK